MTFIAIWICIGLIAQCIFIYVMKQKYPDTYLQEEDDWGWVWIQTIMAILAGPICFLAFAIIFGDNNNED